MGRLSRRTGLSEPPLLLGAGCLVGLTPPFAGFTLSPDVVLFLFLPALLYWEALTSSVREIRDNFPQHRPTGHRAGVGHRRRSGRRGPRVGLQLAHRLRPRCSPGSDRRRGRRRRGPRPCHAAS
nr:hypothetical protein [Streptomyces mirabilis]